ncbi:biopolymer transporter ExbD [Paracoccus homiensis]|uniref:Outer membrane transport energization protein ExbD n=2 Tax=Paracoccus homiensis TaxID=364199 RepID=A0A1I0AFF7_9RHOB|nr:biopolymer transporter ExbD [Paracoccus homiensis]SES92957.1 outer membrane transport energization protein ExbD [Paracoccus homiensis]
MQIQMPRRRQKGETIIPMINVVFLLLVFFLLTAQIAPPTPFEVTPPDSAADQAARDQDVLYVSATGELAYNAARGEDVWPLIEAGDPAQPLEIRADGAVEATTVAALLKRLRAAREAGAQLVVNGG